MVAYYSQEIIFVTTHIVDSTKAPVPYLPLVVEDGLWVLVGKVLG